jgi:hypothetical protein
MAANLGTSPYTTSGLCVITAAGAVTLYFGTSTVTVELDGITFPVD